MHRSMVLRKTFRQTNKTAGLLQLKATSHPGKRTNRRRCYYNRKLHKMLQTITYYARSCYRHSFCKYSIVKQSNTKDLSPSCPEQLRIYQSNGDSFFIDQFGRRLFHFLLTFVCPALFRRFVKRTQPAFQWLTIKHTFTKPLHIIAPHATSLIVRNRMKWKEKAIYLHYFM